MNKEYHRAGTGWALPAHLHRYSTVHMNGMGMGVIFNPLIATGPPVAVIASVVSS